MRRFSGGVDSVAIGVSGTSSTVADVGVTVRLVVEGT